VQAALFDQHHPHKSAWVSANVSYMYAFEKNENDDLMCWKISGATKFERPEGPGGPDVQRPSGPDVQTSVAPLKSFEAGLPDIRHTDWGTIDGFSIKTAMCTTVGGGAKLLVMYMNKLGGKGGVMNLTLLRLQDTRLGGGRGRVSDLANRRQGAWH
jgi:hypothetical protein